MPDSGTPRQPSVVVTVDPKVAYLAPGATQQFTCSVMGATDQSCTWSVAGGAANGAITADGRFTAPSTQGDSQVIATSKADTSATGSGSVVVQSAAAGMPGVWTNVTPRGINLDSGANGGSNYGVQDVLVDPVRPNDLYMFVCFQGVWKSTDYGATWTGPINTGPGGDKLNNSKPWTAVIDPTLRDPSTPPTLWTAAGGSAVGVMKSTDGGVSWTAYATNNSTAGASNNYYANDAYALDIDPYDGKHLISGFHGQPGISESTDGGETWNTIPVPSDIGSSLYPFFIDMGNAKDTRVTWVTVSQHGDDKGSFHTANGGMTWTKVETFDHYHGNSQVWNVGKGVAYVGAFGGVFKTSDGGAHWQNLSTVNANGVVGTATKLYAAFGWATGGTWDPAMQVADRSMDGSWSAVTAPSTMSNGPKRTAVTYDGKHYILVAGSWNAGLWRYIE